MLQVFPEDWTEGMQLTHLMGVAHVSCKFRTKFQLVPRTQ